MYNFSYTIETNLSNSLARTGRIVTPHGEIETPAFFPVGTQATVKTMTPDDLIGLGTQGILCNTYHLYLRPGPDVIQKLGGLHGFMAWPWPIMTDSGGFQVFSLGYALEHGVGKIAKMFPGEAVAPTRPNKPRLTKIDENGVVFVSHLDGSIHRLNPEISIAIQEKLGADVMLAFDECTSPLSGYEYTRAAMERTHRWAVRSLQARTSATQALYGIVQGGAYKDLREDSARFIGALPFDGIAIGGSLGKSKEDMHRVLDWTISLLPDEKPRHLLGIGEPEDIFACVERGIDTFDCVAPTRLARHGALYTASGRLNIKNATFREDPAPVEADCGCYTCHTFSRAYLRHLFVADEILGYRLATIHNLQFILRLAERIRDSIRNGMFFEFRREFLNRYSAQSKAG